MLREEGLENVFARHRAARGGHPRARCAAGASRCCALDEREHSGSLTAVVTPEADAVRKIILERFDMSLGAGLGKLAGPRVPDRPPRRLQRPDARRARCAASRWGCGSRACRCGQRRRGRAGAARARAGAGVSALAGLRVLELTQVMAGPFCGQVLARHGRRRDQGRAARAATRRASRWATPAFLAVNRNKRSIALDLKAADAPRRLPPAGARRRRRARELPPRRGGPARRRLGRRCRELNPRLIYASDLRLRADRPVRAAAGLRPDRPGPRRA